MLGNLEVNLDMNQSSLRSKAVNTYPHLRQILAAPVLVIVTNRLSRKAAMSVLSEILSRLKFVTMLPCEILMSEKFMPFMLSHCGITGRHTA